MRKIAFFSVLLLCACSGDNENNTEKSEIVLISEAIQNDPTNTILLLDRANYNKDLNNLESALFLSLIHI